MKHKADGLFYVDTRMLRNPPDGIGACDWQLQKFKKHFGHTIVITHETVSSAIGANLDVRWLLRRLPSNFIRHSRRASGWIKYYDLLDIHYYNASIDTRATYFMKIIEQYAYYRGLL